MNQKTLRTWKPRLTADEERVVEKGLRLLLLIHTKALREAKERGDWMLKTGLELEIDQILAAGKSLQLDVDREEGDEEEHVESSSEEV